MEARATTKGRIVIPVAVRRKLGIKEGTRIHVAVDETHQRIILTPITREFIRSLRGKDKGLGLLKSLMEDRKRERDL